MIPFSHGSANGPQGVTTGFFGKLPSHGDFVRWNVVGDAVTTVERWVEQGFRSAAAAGGGASLAHCQPVCFLMSPRDTGESVLGVLRAGVDRTGREYPFVAFRVVPGQGSGYLPSEILGAQLAFFAGLTSVAAAPMGTLTADAVRRELVALEPGARPSRGNWRGALAERPLADVSAALGGAGAANGGQALARDLHRRIESLRDPASVRRRGGLALPATAAGAETGALFWARAIETVCGEERCPPLSLTWPLSLHLPADGVAIAAFVGLPPTAHMAHLIAPRRPGVTPPLMPLETLLPDDVSPERVASLRAPQTLSGLLDSLQGARSAS
ncbi:type VI secretion system-associated protein TagF [Aquisalimonas asiatica]|uniref:Type VI secretion-associated protein, BMA_A0400 family n=1 Tax=Aquisalimonas asiatica TaxID=406100 RepID=A0A1H8UIQ2_9GAMM|nr:type VI secretion system-associated protein TagF [Aquisalimonas asiatica]SEP03109.1 type VI secretion-associated protein, BMA_A0400 family [Aquisalimonas asiatica]